MATKIYMKENYICTWIQITQLGLIHRACIFQNKNKKHNTTRYGDTCIKMFIIGALITSEHFMV